MFKLVHKATGEERYLTNDHRFGFIGVYMPFIFNVPEYFNEEDWELKRFTGFKDKYDTDIYEDDVVMYEYTKRHARVVYSKILGSFTLFCPENNDSLANLCRYCKVIKGE